MATLNNGPGFAFSTGPILKHFSQKRNWRCRPHAYDEAVLPYTQSLYPGQKHIEIMQSSCGWRPTHLLVFEALPVDEEHPLAQELGRQHPAHAHPAEAAVLGQPAPAGVVSGHHHRFHAHNVAVTVGEHHKWTSVTYRK